MTNASDRVVTILRVVNGKPCCGEVAEPDRTTLEPGQSATFRVTLRVGADLGALDHYAVVETDHPEAPAVEFWTHAQVHPRVRLEGQGESMPVVLMGTSRPLRLTVFAYGTADRPALALDDVQVTVPFDMVWNGPSRRQPRADGLIELARDLEVSLSAANEPGLRSETLLLSFGDSNDDRFEFPLRWEVREAVRAIPSALVIRETTGEVEKTVRIATADQSAIAILQVTSDDQRIATTSDAATDAKPAHMLTLKVRLSGAGDNSRRHGAVEVVTDHPAQPSLRIPIVFVNAGT